MLLFCFTFSMHIVSASPSETHNIFFNPDGGSHYHTDARCESVAENYLPLRAIPDADLTAAPYEKLTPCPVCCVPDTWYFNPDGGSFYHADQQCDSVHTDYLPLTRIPDADLTAEPYQKLTACTFCIGEPIE